MAHVLVIDDDRGTCTVLNNLVSEMGHRAACAHNIEEGMRAVSENAYDAVFLDVQLPDGNGLSLLPEIRKSPSGPEVIIMTGFGDPEGAGLAIRNGAWDYQQKPLSPKTLALSLSRVFQYRENLLALRSQSVAFDRAGIVGEDPTLTNCIEQASVAAGNKANLLITGETGTGKDLFAQAVHRNGPRHPHPFVVVDCAALPENLVEGVLFGHVKGAFTGADGAREGLVKQADGGTLFLDEIGELPLAIQKKFLRVLQEHRFRPVGCGKELKSDFRLIAATHRDLETMVKEGHFRSDLLFRLKALRIDLPPLRLHAADIEPVLNHHLQRLCRQWGQTPKTVSVEYLTTLSHYRWPGNVRELVNAVESSLLAAGQGPVLLPIHLPMEIRIAAAQCSVGPADPAAAIPMAENKVTTAIENYKAFMQACEKHYLQRLVADTGGQVASALGVSGLSRSKYYSLLKKHQINRG